MQKSYSNEKVKNLIVVSDLHAGCQFALCPPVVHLDSGATYHANALQRKLYKLWKEEFWGRWVPQVTHGQPYAVCVNGDTTDGRHHKATTQISQNLNDQKRIAKALLEPIVELCGGRFYMTRGTEAHVGQTAENEENLAEELGAIPDEHGNYARNELWIRVGSALTHILHHIGTTGSMAYETTALMKEFSESCAEAGRWKLEPPQFIVRSHRHRCTMVTVPIDAGLGVVVTTPAWQAKTPLAWRIPGARLTTPMFGGVAIIQGDEEAYVRYRCWTAERSRTVEL